MRIQIKKVVTAATVALALTVSAPAFAKGDKGEKGKWHEKMAAELNLTAEQKEKMKQVHQTNHEAMRAKRKAMKEARESLQTSLQGTATDAELKKKFEDLEKLQSEFAKARFEKVLAMRAVLTPEQRQKFKGMRKEHRGFGHKDNESEDDE